MPNEWESAPVVGQPQAQSSAQPAWASAPVVKPAPSQAVKPDFKTDDDVIRFFKYDPEVIKKSRYYKPGDFINNITDTSKPGILNTIGRELGSEGYGGNQVLGAVLHGLSSAGHGGSQLVVRAGRMLGANSEADVAYKDLAQKFADWDYRVNWRHEQPQTTLQKVGDLTGQVMGTPGPAIAKAETVLGKMAAGGAAGGLTALFAPVNTDPKDPNSYAKQKALQVGAGTVLGGTVPVAVEKGLPLFTKWLGKARVAFQPTTELTPEMEQLQEAARQYGIRTRPGDITGNPQQRAVEDRLLRTSPKMQDFVAGQNREAQEAAQNLGATLGQEMARTQYANMDAVKKAAAKGDKRAISLLQDAQNAGDDWARILQTSGNMRAFEKAQRAGRLYDKLDELSAQAGDVPLMRTMQAIKTARAELQSSALPDKSALAIVNELERNLAAEQAGIQQGAVAAGGGTAPGQPASMVDRSYAGMRRLRSDLGDLINDYYKGSNAVTGSKGVGILSSVRNALEQDMNDFAQKSPVPGMRQAWKEADAYYRANVVPYKDRLLAGALKNGNPDEVFGKFIQAGKGDRAQQFYNSLDPKGQAAVKVGLIQQALEKAAKPERGGESITFSPAQFAGELERLKSATDVAFKGPDLWKLDGLVKVMRAVDRSGNVGATALNGSILEGPLANVRMMGEASAATAALATGHPGVAAAALAPEAYMALHKARMNWLYTSPEGQQLLLRAHSLTPGSKAFDQVLQQISARMPRALGAEAARQQQSPDPIARLMGPNYQPEQ